MNTHEQSMHILMQIKQILAEYPGSLKDHQQRINSTDYLQERLELLDSLESAQVPAETLVVE